MAPYSDPAGNLCHTSPGSLTESLKARESALVLFERPEALSRLGGLGAILITRLHDEEARFDDDQDQPDGREGGDGAHARTLTRQSAVRLEF